MLSDVTVIVVTYNSAHCLPALSPLLSQCPSVILSDNASADGCGAEAQRLWPHATVLAHPRNLGFGAANNRALALVKTPFALLLNPDCEMTPGQLTELLAQAHQFPDAAMVAPQLVEASGQAQVNYRWHRTPPKRSVPASGPLCVGFVCGAAMLLRLSQMQGVGFFDESFFLYYEDDDLCWRLFEAGRPMLIAPQVQVVHRSRGSVRGPRPLQGEYLRGHHHVQSKLLFARKHHDAGKARSMRRQLLWQTCLTLVLRLVVFSPKHLARNWGRLTGAYRWSESPPASHS